MWPGVGYRTDSSVIHTEDLTSIRQQFPFLKTQKSSNSRSTTIKFSFNTLYISHEALDETSSNFSPWQSHSKWPAEFSLTSAREMWFVVQNEALLDSLFLFATYGCKTLKWFYSLLSIQAFHFDHFCNIKLVQLTNIKKVGQIKRPQTLITG